MRISCLDRWILESEEMESLSRADIEALQLRKLNTLLRRLKKRNGFYSALPESLEHLKDLQMLPFTTADDLVKHLPSLTLVSQSSIARVISAETSGTTREAKRVFYTEKDLERTEEFFAGGLSELISSKDTVAVCMPFSYGGGLGGLISRAIERLGATALKLGVGTTYAELETAINNHGASVYVGFPIPLLSLLRLNPKGNTLKRALLSGDSCSQRIKGLIDDLLGSSTYLHYGLRETVYGCAVECSAHQGMHIRENDLIVEVVDGELVITTIASDALPLVRYRTGDRASLTRSRCACGSNLYRLSNIERRGEARIMALLDAMIFPCEAIIDYRVSLVTSSPQGKKAIVEVITNTRVAKEQIAALVAPHFPEHQIEVRFLNLSLESKPFYEAKRKIELVL